jgi:hypothetical protein
MPGRPAKTSSPVARATQAGKRMWPYVLIAWERWQALSDEEKERYRKRAKELAAKGREFTKHVHDQGRGTAKKRKR